MKTIIVAFVLGTSVFTVQATTIPTAMRTADSQMKGTKSDVELTRKIRDRIMNEDSLSMAAHNINIVTLGNSVTLKGEVENKAEIGKVSAIAKELAGSKTVNTQLTVIK